MEGISTYVLYGSGRLKPHKTEIEHAVANAVKLISEKIPLSDIDIVAFDYPFSTREGMGIGGYADPNTVWTSLDPAFLDFNKVISEEIRRTLAHELHHCIRTRGPGYGWTLFEAMISDGLADHFVIEMWGKPPYPWDTALTRTQRERLLKRAKRVWNRRVYDNRWFGGKKSKDIPKWTGYSIGFWLVGQYLSKHPTESAASLVSAPAERFTQ